MSACWIVVGLAGYLFAFLLDEGYEYKTKTRKNEVLHKVYAIIGVISFTVFILALVL